MSLTVAIPTMDRWTGFLEHQLPIYLDHPKIDCVVICDENGNDISAICEAGFDMNPKLRLYQNDKVLGVYGNKRQCLLKAPTDLVAVLDSDNQFDPAFFDTALKIIEADGENSKNTIYCAAQNERLFMNTGVTENRIAHFSGMKISRDNWNRVLNMPCWNFLLNDGNSIWPKSVCKYFPDLPEEEIVGTDSIFFMFKAINSGYTLSVEPNLKYIHTVHDGSHWLQNAEVSSKLLGMRDWRV
jgi:glycosyltransferase involved in cell wall biosynthesis